MSVVAALLEIDRARIDIAGSPLADDLSVVSQGDRVALVGDWRVLFLLLGAQASVVSGRASIDGCDAGKAVALGVVGLAPFEPALPAAWTAEEYLVWSSRLAGIAARAARGTAAHALESLGLLALSPRKLGTLMPMERRALMVAHASIGNPRVLALDRPLARLDEAAQRWLRELLERAALGRRLLVSVDDAYGPGVERALVEDAAEVLVKGPADLVLQGPAATTLVAGGRYLVTVLGGAAELASRLVERGARIEQTTHSGHAARLVIALPEGADPGIVVHASADVAAPVIELVALGSSPPPAGHPSR